ncbi:hypothetical protein ABK040_005680 [Willaertia magna]
MSNQYKRVGSFYCKYCSQWMRDTPSEKKKHERSKHHIKNLQTYIKEQQQNERNKEKELNKNKKILERIEKKVDSSIGTEENVEGNRFYKQYLEQQKKINDMLTAPPTNFLVQNEEQVVEEPQPVEQKTEGQNKINTNSYEFNDMPLTAHLETNIESQVDQIPIQANKEKKNKKKDKQKHVETNIEIGSYYDDPNYFYYDHEDEEKEEEQKKKEETKTENKEEEEIVIEGLPEKKKKSKPSSSWKSQYDNISNTAPVIGQWEVVSVKKRDPVAKQEDIYKIHNSHMNDFNSSSSTLLTHNKKNVEEHEEDKLGGSYSFKGRNTGSENNKKRNMTSFSFNIPINNTSNNNTNNTSPIKKIKVENETLTNDSQNNKTTSSSAGKFSFSLPSKKK